MIFMGRIKWIYEKPTGIRLAFSSSIDPTAQEAVSWFHSRSLQCWHVLEHCGDNIRCVLHIKKFLSLMGLH